MTDDLLRRDDEIHSETEASENAPLIGGEAAPALGQAQPPLVVSRPAPGQPVVLDVSPDQVLVLNLEPASAQVRIEGDDLVLGFDADGDGQDDSALKSSGRASVCQSGEILSVAAPFNQKTNHTE